MVGFLRTKVRRFPAYDPVLPVAHFGVVCSLRICRSLRYWARITTTSLVLGRSSTSNCLKSSSGVWFLRTLFRPSRVVLMNFSLNLLTRSLGFLRESSDISSRKEWNCCSSFSNSQTSFVFHELSSLRVPRRLKPDCNCGA